MTVSHTDILAVGTYLDHRRAVEIQVKTASDKENKTSWPLGGVTQIMAASEHEWFVFVLLPKLRMAPSAFVVPRDHVSAADSGYNVVFWQTTDDTPLAYRDNQAGLWLANRFRLYADLRRDPRRGREQAAHLRQEVIGF